MKKKTKQRKVRSARQKPPITGSKRPLFLAAIDRKTNWLVSLMVILPFVISTETLDSNLVIRYLVQSIFVCLYLMYFLALRRTSLQLPKSPLIKWIFYLGVGFAAWSLVCQVVAINPAEGWYEIGRWILNLLLLYIAWDALRQKGAFPSLCKAMVLIAAAHGLVGILQHLGMGFTELPGNYPPYGYMANRNLFGSALMLMLPFVFIAMIRGNRIWRFLAVISAFITLAGILLSLTRSAWLGTALMLAIPLGLALVYLPSRRKRWLQVYGLAFAGGVILMAVVIFGFRDAALSHAILDRVSALDQYAEVETESTETINDRLQIWSATTRLAQDHPVTGVGTGNWEIAVLQHAGRVDSWSSGVFSPDRPHNQYLHIASETGIPGAILHFGIWMLMGILCLPLLSGQTSTIWKIDTIWIAGGLAAFAADSFFSFPSERIEHSLLIVLLAGALMARYTNERGSETMIKSTKKWIWLSAGILIGLGNLWMGLEKYGYEERAKMARAYRNTGDHQRVLREVEAAKSPVVTLDPYGDPVELYSAIALQGLKRYDEAMTEAAAGLEHHPYSARLLSTIGTIQTDQGNYNKAIEYLERARNILPRYHIILKNLAVNYFEVGRYEACVEALRKVDIEGDTYFTDLQTEAGRRTYEQDRSQ